MRPLDAAAVLIHCRLQVLVKFFDTGDYSWIPRNKVCPYRYGSAAPVRHCGPKPARHALSVRHSYGQDAGSGKSGGGGAGDPSYARAVRDAQRYLEGAGVE